MIVQFSHNGEELNLSKRSPKNGSAYAFDPQHNHKGLRFWNNERSHKRKFIQHPGWYLECTGDAFDPIPKKGEICFWGEWEPQSWFKLTGNRYSKSPALPHAIHYPVFSTHGTQIHNTDPFVFGQHFYYTNCKQWSYPFLRSLTNGTIIIFGSEKGKSDFILDTVFVVGSSELVQDSANHSTDYPLTLRQATIDLHAGLSPNLRLYRGKMYDSHNPYMENKPEPFCFVPCKTDGDLRGFERPVIDWRRFQLKKPGAGTATYRVTYSSTLDFWQDLVVELIKQGFSLGIQLEMPTNHSPLTLPISPLMQP